MYIIYFYLFIVILFLYYIYINITFNVFTLKKRKLEVYINKLLTVQIKFTFHIIRT